MESKCSNPDCNYVYLWRYKPPECPVCKTHLGWFEISFIGFSFFLFGIGGKYESKKRKLSAETSDRVVSVGGNTYSIHNHRHFRVVCKLYPGMWGFIKNNSSV